MSVKPVYIYPHLKPENKFLRRNDEKSSILGHPVPPATRCVRSWIISYIVGEKAPWWASGKAGEGIGGPVHTVVGNGTNSDGQAGRISPVGG